MHADALFLVLLALLLPLTASSSSLNLSTIAIAVDNATAAVTVCALVHTDHAISGTSLRCADFDDPSNVEIYQYGKSSFNAVVAGDGFLCAVGGGGNVSEMRWWGIRSGDAPAPTKRLYHGVPLGALSAGRSHVCGVVGGQLQCWRWPAMEQEEGQNISAIAVGGDFVCVIKASDGGVACFGEDGGGAGGVVGGEPTGKHVVLDAGDHHACAISDNGTVSCWGRGALVAPRISQLGTVTMLALGADGLTCVLWSNWTASCWPESLPDSLAGMQFFSIETRGPVVCGVLMLNYSLVCWKRGERAEQLLFKFALPAPCERPPACKCQVWPGSGAELCNGNGAVCQPCGFGNGGNGSDISPPPPPPPPSESDVLQWWVYVLIGIGGVGIGAVLLIILFVLAHRRKRQRESGRVHSTELATASPTLSTTVLEQFPLAVLRRATGNFSDSHRVGAGSFGTVYRATLSDGRVVAIKRAKTPRSQELGRRRSDNERQTAFVTELSLLSRVNHRNLVRLHGYCADSGERVLVYEFMSNGNLFDHLHRKPALPPPLASWRGRLALALDAARGIQYMHVFAVPPIIHRDVKSTNILLDESWAAKVSDLGLSTLKDDGNDQEGNGGDDAPRAAGTVGYMDPEYYRLRHLTTKSDVYSFGVVLLELLSGCRAVQRYDDSNTPRNVVEQVVPLIAEDEISQVLDKRLALPTPVEMEAVTYLAYLAADCVSRSGQERPTMSEVVAGLERAVAACTPTVSAPPSRSSSSNA